MADYNTSDILADSKTRVTSWLTIKPGSLVGWLQSHIWFFLMKNGSMSGCHSTHVTCNMTRGKYNQIPIDVWWTLGQQQDGREHIGLTLPPRCDGALPAATCWHKLTYIIFPTASIAFSRSQTELWLREANPCCREDGLYTLTGCLHTGDRMSVYRRLAVNIKKVTRTQGLTSELESIAKASFLQTGSQCTLRSLISWKMWGWPYSNYKFAYKGVPLNPHVKFFFIIPMRCKSVIIK